MAYIQRIRNISSRCECKTHKQNGEKNKNKNNNKQHEANGP